MIYKLKLTFIAGCFVLLNVININTAYSNSSNITNTYYSKSLPKNKPVPGGIAVIPLDLDSINLPIVFFKNKRVLVIKYQDQVDHEKQFSSNWVAIVGIPMETHPGIEKIEILINKNNNKIIEKSFSISNKNYSSEKLKLSPKFINPPITDQMRINKEKKLIQNAYNYWSDSLPNLSLRLPIVNAYKSSIFGLKRILNGQYRGFHTGLDLAAPIGTDVYPAASGTVILTGNFFYSGNLVFIDHGQGFITNYCHLNSISVKEGDLVDTNTIIGTVGVSGRVTGPHLHWSVSLNNVRVDPELFLLSN